MLKLKLEILNGGRSGSKISLSQRNDGETSNLPHITENESIKFELKVSHNIVGASILLYDNRISFSEVTTNTDGKSKNFFWKPSPGYFGYSYDTLFNNYFGVAELQVELEAEDGSYSLVDFLPIEILASKLSAERVEEMLKFLAKQNNNEIYSAFHATKRKSGFKEGDQEPDMALEKIELVTKFLEERIPLICHSPITRLTPKKTVTYYQENLYPDESSIAWLSENLSVLIPTQEPEKAVLNYEGDYYTTDTLQIPVIQESPNLYENQVIHGFLDFILQEARHLSKNMDLTSSFERKSRNNDNGEYKSFFDIMSRFSKDLLEPKKERCKLVLRKLEFLRDLLIKKIPVRVIIRDRPHITPKVRVNRLYLDLFHRAISWHEYKRPDWGVYENLFGIQSIPKLFETYCFFRVLSDLKFFLHHKEGFTFFDENENEIELLNEPDFWMRGSRGGEQNEIVNSEGWTVSKNKKNISKRKIAGPYCKRVPDIVIKITTNNGSSRLLVFDAKYSNENKSFTEYLPQLTMKYVHGLHGKSSGAMATSSLTILCPSKSGLVRSFHCQEYAYDGATPAEPSLQVIGLTPSEETEDKLQQVIKRILELNRVSLMASIDT